MRRTLSAILLFLFPAIAAAEPTQGFYVAGGLMNQQLKARLQSSEIFDSAQVGINSSSSRYGSGGTLLAGYQFPFTSSGSVMLEVGTDRGVDSSFSASGVSAPNETLDVHWKVSRNWFLAVKPGIRFGDGLTGYVSFAYHDADAELSRTVSGTQNNTRIGVRSLGGFGIGLGLQGYLSERVFIRGEVENIRFSRNTIDLVSSGSGGTLVSLHSIQPEAIVGRMIIGYRF